MSDNRTQLIAEIGANHAGDIDLAIRMIEAAAASGAQWVKFQSWRAETLREGEAHPNYNWYVQSQLSDDDHHRLITACEANQIGFLTTCFDLARVPFLSSLGLSTVKVASPDLASHTMIKELRKNFDHLIVSTGMSFDDEIEQTGTLLRGTSFTFMHCVSLYPTPLESVNLARMDWLRSFTPSVGYSDHTFGTEAAKLAVGRGAAYIEKHFTLSRYLPGKDQAVSCEPHELRQIADHIALVEKMMGTVHPSLSENEGQMRQVYIGKWGDNH
jgi:N,N'-diacetyllegionaminate synthase